MKCIEAARDEVFEHYLAARLSPAEQEAFEDHYFSCPDCFAKLQALQALQTELIETAPAIRKEHAESRPGWLWRWQWMAAAALVVLAAGLYVWQRPSTPTVSPPQVAVAPQPPPPAPTPATPLPTLSELAAFQPPPYTPITLRGPADEATLRCRDAMQHYVKGDHRGAIAGLRSASELDPKAPRIQFFLGICYLLTHDTAAGIDALKKTIELGKSPFLEGAHFYLAKGYLRTGNIEGAREQLELTVQQRGDLQSEADRLLLELAKLSRSPHK